MIPVALLFAAALSAAAPALSSSGALLTFLERGSPVAQLSPADVKAISKPRELSLRDPHADAARSVLAVAVLPLLDHVYGERWRKSGGVVLRGADGYEAQISVERLTLFHADLPFAFADGKPFTMTPEGSSRARLQSAAPRECPEG